MSRQIRYAKQNGVDDDHIFKEYASGGRKERKKLNELLSLLEENDIIYCSSLDRISRSISQMLEIADICKTKKICLNCADGFILDCRGEISLSTSIQLLTLSYVSEIQRLTIVSSVLDGLDMARERNGGKNPGGQPKLTIERLHEKNSDFFKYYAMYKNKQISMIELARLSQISRNTAYSYVKLLEKED